MIQEVEGSTIGKKPGARGGGEGKDESQENEGRQGEGKGGGGGVDLKNEEGQKG